MDSENNSANPSPTNRISVDAASDYSHKIKCPGLTPGRGEIYSLAADLPKRLAIFLYKELNPTVWVVFVGGTGTGKSTLFNAFCGKPLSETGVERPKTCGPIAYAHRRCKIEKDFPLTLIQIERQASEDSYSGVASGEPGYLLILEHAREELAHLVIVDTPDLDSVEAKNREIAQDLCLFADAVVFITSQEKYADEIPYQLLTRIRQENRPYFLLLNKAQEFMAEEEVIISLQSRNISLPEDRVWSIPYAPGGRSQWISEQPGFRDFANHLLLEISTDRREEFRKTQNKRRAAYLSSQIDKLISLMKKEERAGEQWLNQLDALYQKAAQDLIEEQKERFAAESRQYLQKEIRKLFTKYDLLAKPRRYFKKALVTPLRLLGFGRKDDRELHKQGILKVRQKINLTPVQIATLRFNRSVLEKLSPSDQDSPLFTKLREPGVQLNESDIMERIWEEQDRIADWLEETFEKLSKGISKGKEWGIYSTSVLWGILILSFEAAVGGGFTVLDAALDTALAPFVTKGAVELFAYHEIQKVARELARRYQEGLLSVLRVQRDRYEHCLKSLTTPLEELESLRRLLA